MPIPARDYESLERDLRSAGEQRKSTKEFQPLQQISQLHWGPSLNAPMQIHVEWGINKRRERCAHGCRARILLLAQRHGGIAPRTGVWEWKDTGSLGRTDKEDEEEVSFFTPVTSWSAWRSAWGWMRSQPTAYGSGLKREQEQMTL